MVKRKTTPRKSRAASPARRIYRRRAKKSGTQYIPAAMATVSLVYANADNLKRFADKIGADGVKAIPNLVMGQGNDYKWLRQQFTKGDQLVKDAAYYAGGYLGGEVVKKYAPSVIKTPLGKLAKKIPRM